MQSLPRQRGGWPARDIYRRGGESFCRSFQDPVRAGKKVAAGAQFIQTSAFSILRVCEFMKGSGRGLQRRLDLAGSRGQERDHGRVHAAKVAGWTSRGGDRRSKGSRRKARKKRGSKSRSRHSEAERDRGRPRRPHHGHRVGRRRPRIVQLSTSNNLTSGSAPKLKFQR